MVTSFRPKDATLADDSRLLTVRPVSDLNETYYQWADYRVEIAEERCRRLVKGLRARKHVGRDFDVTGVKNQLRGLIEFLENTGSEIVDPSRYSVGAKGEEEEVGEGEEEEEDGEGKEEEDEDERAGKGRAKRARLA